MLTSESGCSAMSEAIGQKPTKFAGRTAALCSKSSQSRKISEFRVQIASKSISLHSKLLTDFLKAGDNGIYWIGTQTTLRFDISSVAGNYSNFEGNDLHNGNGTDEHLLPEPVHQMCGAISSRNGGRWMNRECLEKHSFICQI